MGAPPKQHVLYHHGPTHALHYARAIHVFDEAHVPKSHRGDIQIDHPRDGGIIAHADVVGFFSTTAEGVDLRNAHMQDCARCHEHRRWMAAMFGFDPPERAFRCHEWAVPAGLKCPTCGVQVPL